MFGTLTERLKNALNSLRGQETLNEKNTQKAFEEIQRALLAADVHFGTVKDFIARLRADIQGQTLVAGLSASEQLMGRLYEAIVELLGKTPPPETPPEKLLLVGLNGMGKTTTAAKLAHHYTKKGLRPALIACDVYRPAAAEQLQILGEQAKVPVYTEKGSTDPIALGQRALQWGQAQHLSPLIFDTAGRLQLNSELMRELQNTQKNIQADATYLIADAAVGQQNVAIAQAFHENVPLQGIILTRLDGDPRGGAALSMKARVGVPILWMGTGEQLNDLETFHPERIARRILDMGDLASLAEKTHEHISEAEGQHMQAKLKGGAFNFEDFLQQVGKMRKMGNMESLLKLLPGTSQLKVGEKEEKRLLHQEALMLSMTPQERRQPHLIDSARRKRIARGAGLPLSKMNQLLKQLQVLRKQMKNLGSNNPQKKRLPNHLQKLLGDEL